MAEVTLPPGFELVEEPTSGLPPGFLVEQAGAESAPESFPAATSTVAGLRTAPAIGRAVARVAANHPAATQKVVGAGITTAASGTGAVIGGGPGALVGASVRGVTPSQSTIRETAGRLAGETPAVAKNAGRAMGVVHYADEAAGMKLSPKGLVSTGEPAKAVDNFAKSMGQKVVRILDPYGKVVVGPEAAHTVAKRTPGIVSKGASALSRILGPLSGMTGVTDMAQTAEPNRRDIGILGIGASQPPDDWSRNQAALRAKILAMLGM